MLNNNHEAGIPNCFREHFVTDSLFISKDKMHIRIICRYFGKLAQIDSNELNNYTLVKEKNFSTYINDNRKYLKKGDSVYMFNYVKGESHDNKTDAIILQHAIQVRDSNCYPEFPFGDCPFRLIYHFGDFKINDGKGGQISQDEYFNCYKITEYKKIMNNAEPFEIVLPLEHSFIASGRPYLELHEYLKSWEPSIKIFLKPSMGSYDSEKKIWMFNYDTTNSLTTGTIEIYNGATDTLFIPKCYTTAGYATVESFPRFLAPASWGVIKIQVNHGERKPYLPHNSLIWLEVLKGELKKDYVLYPIQYEIH